MIHSAAGQAQDEPSLVSLLERGADSGTGVTFIDGRNAERVPWARIHDDALRCGRALEELGVGNGSRVAIVGVNTREIVTAIQATWLAGASVSVMAIPTRSPSRAQFAADLAARVRAAAPKLVVMDESFQGALAGSSEAPVIGARVLCSREVTRRNATIPVAVPANAAAVVQYTSGSTSDPRGVVVSRSQLARHAIAIAKAADFRTGAETVMSWLPLFHDMGLIGFLCVPMLIGLDLVLADTAAFLRSPKSWMEWVSASRATVTGAPNFAYGLAARTLHSEAQLDLSQLRLAFNGAEPIDPSTVDAFVASGARLGLDARAMFCVYGLAEATLAVTFPRPGTGMQVDTVDEMALENSLLARPVNRGRRLVALGSALPDLRIRVVDPVGRLVLPDRTVGEIEIRGPSVTSTYLDRGGTEFETLLQEGWLRTGDRGYSLDEQLVVCGRATDIIIIAGRNIYPQDVERSVSTVPGIRKGNVIAFGCRNGTREGIVVIAEHRGNDTSRGAVANAVRDSIGITPRDVVLLAPGSLPKTSSGKLRRSECRLLYEAGSLI